MEIPTERQANKRPTGADIARRAGVSIAAVSYALNNRPGVSIKTRDYILSIAAELGWTPHDAARRLSSTRTETIGMTIARPEDVVAHEPFFATFLAGLSAFLAGRSYSLTVRSVGGVEEEIRALDRWWSGRMVDGVVLLDVRVDDPRVPFLEQTGLPAVMVGGPLPEGTVSTVWSDDEAGTREAVVQLAAMGHRHMARISDAPKMLYADARNRSMRRTLADLGLPEPLIMEHGPRTPRAADLVATILEQVPRPTVIICETDMIGLAALSELGARGVDVPGEMSLMVWDDSLLCEIARPTLTAMARDVLSYGRHAGAAILDQLTTHAVVEELDNVPTFVARGSTAAVRPSSSRSTGSK